jgi:hypothetical protein
MVCYDTAENLFVYTARKVTLFADFTQIILSFFQNLLANIVNMTNIYKNITNAINNNNMPALW